MIGAGNIFEFYCEVVDYKREDYTVGDMSEDACRSGLQVATHS